MKRVVALAIVAALWASDAGAQQSSHGPIAVENAWARATPGNAQTGAAYLTLINRGDTTDRLVSVSTPVAEKAELHENKVDNGIMKMRPTGPITVAPGRSEVFKPGGEHVMLMGLKHPLKEGDSFPLTLTFEKGSTAEVSVKVEKAGAMGMGAMAPKAAPPMEHGTMPGMDHGKM
jgi:copper(I)-binding protein